MSDTIVTRTIPTGGSFTQSDNPLTPEQIDGNFAYLDTAITQISKADLGSIVELVGNPASDDYLPTGSLASRSEYTDLDAKYPFPELASLNITKGIIASSLGDIVSLVSNGTIFCGVTSSGVIVTSPNTVTWTQKYSAGQALNKVIWTGAYFVAVGNRTLLYSSDGVNWTASTYVTTDNIIDVASVDAMIVVINAGNKLAYCATGPNGTFAEYTNASITNWTTLATSSTTFIAVGKTGTTSYIVKSTNATTWTLTATLANTQLNKVAWGAEASTFCAVGNGGIVYTSPDGTTWTNRSITGENRNINSIGWNRYEFCAVGDNALVYTGKDGITWTNRSIAGTTANMTVVTNCNKLFIVAGAVGATYFSYDTRCGFSSYGLSQTTQIKTAAWNNDVIVMAGAAGAMYVSTSQKTSQASIITKAHNKTVTGLPAGVTCDLSSASYMKGYAFSPSANLYVAIFLDSASGTYGTLTSSDHINWAYGATLSGITASTIKYYNGFFFIYGGAKIQKSSDGVNWVQVYSGATTITKLGFTDGGLLYAVAGANLIISDAAYTTWTNRPISVTIASRMAGDSSSSFGDVYYANNKYILSGTYHNADGNYYNFVATSADGISWINRTITNSLGLQSDSSIVYTMNFDSIVENGAEIYLGGWNTGWNGTSSAGRNGAILKSTDGGVTWSYVVLAGFPIYSLTYSKNAKKFITNVNPIEGTDGTISTASYYYTCSPLGTWSRKTYPLTGIQVKPYSFNDVVYFTKGNTGTTGYYTIDGVNLISYNPNTLIYSSASYMDKTFINIKDSSLVDYSLFKTSMVYTTPITMSMMNISNTTSTIISVAYSDALDLLVGVGKDGAIITSADGYNWTSRSSGVATQLNKVVWFNDKFVAVGIGGVVLTSTNGTAWTAQASTITADLTDAVANSTDTIVAVGYGKIIYSRDGVTWAAATSYLSTATFLKVIWTGSNFAATKLNSGNGFSYSYNGITWFEFTIDGMSTLSAYDFVYANNMYYLMRTDTTYTAAHSYSVIMVPSTLDVTLVQQLDDFIGFTERSANSIPYIMYHDGDGVIAFRYYDTDYKLNIIVTKDGGATWISYPVDVPVSLNGTYGYPTGVKIDNLYVVFFQNILMWSTDFINWNWNDQTTTIKILQDPKFMVKYKDKALLIPYVIEANDEIMQLKATTLHKHVKVK